MKKPDAAVIEVQPDQAFLLFAVSTYFGQESNLDIAVVCCLLLLLTSDLWDLPEAAPLLSVLPRPRSKDWDLDLDPWLDVIDTKVEEGLMGHGFFYTLNGNGLRVGEAIAEGREPGEGFVVGERIRNMITPKIRERIQARIAYYKNLAPYEIIAKTKQAFVDFTNRGLDRGFSHGHPGIG